MINEGAYIRVSNNMIYSITDEYSTMGKYSLKCTSSNWQWLYYGIPNSILPQVSSPFGFKCDVSTDGGELLIVVVEDGDEITQFVTLSSGESTVEISYTPTSYNFSKIQLGYRSKNVEKTCYIDNIRFLFSKR